MHGIDTNLISEARATTIPQPAPVDLGDLSSAPPERSVLLSCPACGVRWTGCADAADCPKCGKDCLNQTAPDVLARITAAMQSAPPDWQDFVAQHRFAAETVNASIGRDFAKRWKLRVIAALDCEMAETVDALAAELARARAAAVAKWSENNR